MLSMGSYWWLLGSYYKYVNKQVPAPRHNIFQEHCYKRSPKGLHSKLSSFTYIGLTFIKHYKTFLFLCYYPAASVQLLCNCIVLTSFFNASRFNLHIHFPRFCIIEELKRSLVGCNSFCHFSLFIWTANKRLIPQLVLNTQFFLNGY